MQNIFGVHSKWFLLFFALGAGITFGLGRYLEFHVSGIDFWSVLYYGRRMTLAEPGSLYNGFYPLGYAFLIGRMPFTYVRPLAYILNALLAGLFTASVSTLFLHARAVPATLLALYASVAAPFIFATANTLGPDMGAAAFTAFGVFLLWRDRFEGKNEAFSDLGSLLAGASLGLAYSFRSHAIVSSAAIFAAYLLLMGLRPFRPRLLMLGGFAPFVVLQAVVNLLSGHGAFETAQAFNVYKFFYGIDWSNSYTPEEVKQFSILQTILNDPAWAMSLYLPALRYFVSFAWASAVSFLLAPKGRFSRFALFSFIVLILYAIPISLGDSGRGPVIGMSLYLPSLALLLAVLTDQARNYIHSSRWAGFAVTLFFVLAGFGTLRGWLSFDIEFVRNNYGERRTLSVIEQTLRTHGMRSPLEVYADRYDFYTPNTMPYRSRQIGTWNEDWFWGFKEDYPPLADDSWESFARACREQGVRFLVLSPNAHYRGEFFRAIYHDEVDIASLGLEFVGQRGNMRIFKFLEN